jgi:hypothetical protein
MLSHSKLVDSEAGRSTTQMLSQTSKQNPRRSDTLVALMSVLATAVNNSS